MTWFSISASEKATCILQHCTWGGRCVRCFVFVNIGLSVGRSGPNQIPLAAPYHGVWLSLFYVPTPQFLKFVYIEKCVYSEKKMKHVSIPKYMIPSTKYSTLLLPYNLLNDEYCLRLVAMVLPIRIFFILFLLNSAWTFKNIMPIRRDFTNVLNIILKYTAEICGFLMIYINPSSRQFRSNGEKIMAEIYVLLP